MHEILNPNSYWDSIGVGDKLCQTGLGAHTNYLVRSDAIGQTPISLYMFI
jgi:hypothetical protein